MYVCVLLWVGSLIFVFFVLCMLMCVMSTLCCFCVMCVYDCLLCVYISCFFVVCLCMVVETGVYVCVCLVCVCFVCVCVCVDMCLYFVKYVYSCVFCLMRV